MKRNFSHKNYTRGVEELYYINSIRKYKPFTREEEVAAFEAYRNGDTSMKDKIVCSNLYYVYSIASSMAENTDNVMDYNNSGISGLMEAVDKFDHTRGLRFYTYASFYVVRNMYAFKFRENPSIVQSNHAKIAAKAYALSCKFYQEEQRDPSKEELAELFAECGIEVKDMRDLDDIEICSSNDTYGEDSFIEESPEYTIKTSTVNDCVKSAEEEDRMYKLNAALKTLKERDREVVEYLLGLKTGYHVSEDEVAMRMDLSVTRIQQIRNASVQKLHDVIYKMAV